MSKNEMNKLKIIPVDKTVVFNSPIEGDDVLVRTGVSKEGTNFFHAVLRACSSEYASMNKKERTKFVYKLKASMLSKIDKDNWETIGCGVIAKVPFQELLNDVLRNFNKYLNDSEMREVTGRATRKTIKNLISDDTSIEVYQIILSIVTVDQLIGTILPSSYEKTEGKFIRETIDEILKEGSDFINSSSELNRISVSKKEYLVKVFNTFLKVICSEVYKETYKKYIKSLDSVDSEIDSYILNFLSTRLNRNIYFISSDTRLPYMIETTSKDKKSIIVILTSKNHYETIGRLLPGNKIQREFQPDDTLLDKMNTFLLDPNQLNFKYPELIKYTENSISDHEDQNEDHGHRYRNEGDEGDEGDEEDEESDLYYDSSDGSDDSSDDEN